MAKDVHRDVWQSLGEHDPDWAVLSEPEKRYGGWANELDRFYASGRDDVLAVLESLPNTPRGRALDWGSGTGRLSFALAQHFDRVTCVDVSDSMLRALSTRAHQRGLTNIDPVRLDDFVAVSDHDLCLSLLVLQHLPDLEALEQALRLMVSALRPGGHIYVEIPAEALSMRARFQPKFQTYRLLRRLGVRAVLLHRLRLSGISMLVADEAWTRSALRAAGADVEHVIDLGRGGGDYRNLRYVARRAS